MHLLVRGPSGDVYHTLLDGYVSSPRWFAASRYGTIASPERLPPRGQYGMYVRTTPHPSSGSSPTTAVRRQLSETRWNLEHHPPTAGIIHMSGGSVILERRPGAASPAHPQITHPLSRPAAGILDHVHWAGWG